jgi:4-azaleucine resistance transporter AzlC
MTTTTNKLESIHLPKTTVRSSPATTALVTGAREIVPVLFALLPFGLAFGATAAGSGFSPLEALGMSVVVAAGAAQLAAVQLISAGASLAVVVLTVLIINLRFTLYSASLAPHFRRLPLWWKGLLSYHLTDQAYAATITRFEEGETEEPDKRWYFLGTGLAIWTTWQVATMAGVFLGGRVSDRTTGAAALSAGVAAVFAAALPLNLGLIGAAFVGVLGGLAMETLTGRKKK